MRNQFSHTINVTLIAAAVLVLATACSQLGTGGVVSVPTTGDTANDAAAAQQYLPSIPGYLSVEASDIVSAITSVGAPASLITGNPAAAAMFAQIQGMMTCYSSVGAVAARVYAQADIATVLEGQIPSAGVLAVVNVDRVVNNFLPCALGSGRGEGFGAQTASQPCAGSGSIQAANGETITYIYAATNEDLCRTFAGSFR